MSESKHISGMLRGLTMKRTSNRIAVLGSASALIVYLARSVSEQWVVGNPMSVGEALTSSVVVFVAWALTRELDPDHPWPAAVAMVASFVVGLWFVPAALVVVAAAAALRMISGTVGRSLTPIDLGVFVIVGYGSGHELSTWSIGVLILVFLITAPEVGRLRWWAAGALVVGFVASWYLGELNPVTITTTSVATAGGFLALGGLGALRVRVSVNNDARSGPVQSKRLSMSRMAAGLIIASATFIGGFDAMWEMAPVGTALIVVAIVSVIPVLAGPTSDGRKAKPTVGGSVS